jgi:hypothetical protein
VPDEVLRIEPLSDVRRKRAQMAQHVVAAFALASNGWTHLTAPAGAHHHPVLAILEIGAGVLLIAAAAMETLRPSRGLHGRVGWVEIAGAGMLMVEAITRLYEPHTLALRIVSFILPFIILAFGVFDVRLQQMPQLRATDDDFRMRIRFIRRSRVKWADVRTARADSENVYVERNDGTTKRFKMGGLKNRDEAIQWAMEQFRRRGLTAN